MNQSKSIVSIVMNCYNGSKYLSDALDSILEQTYENWELVFWDNQSTDHSSDIVLSYNESRFRYFFARQHTLLYEARNLAVKETNGRFIAFLDTDDWWEPDKLESQIPLFSDPAVGLVYGNYFFLNEKTAKKTIAVEEPLPYGSVLDAFLEKHRVGILTLVVRRESLASLVGPFDPRYHIIGDTDFVLRLATEWQVAAVDRPVATYRWHDNNETKRHRMRQASELNMWLDDAKQNQDMVGQKGFISRRNSIVKFNSLALAVTGRWSEAMKCAAEYPVGVKNIALRCLILILVLKCFLENVYRKISKYLSIK